MCASVPSPPRFYVNRSISGNLNLLAPGTSYYITYSVAYYLLTAYHRQQLYLNPHRKRNQLHTAEDVFPVNGLTFHPRYSETLASCGTDGQVHIWDTFQRRHLAGWQAAGPVSAVA